MTNVQKKMRKSSINIAKLLLLGLSLNIAGCAYAAASANATSTGGSFSKELLEHKTEKESINDFYAAFLKNQVEAEGREERLKQELRHKEDYNPNHPELPKIFEIESMKLLMRYFDSKDTGTDTNKVETYFSANVYNDLNVFPDPQNPKKVTVFSDFSNLTSTMAGKLGLLEMLGHPLSDIEKLRERQRIIEHLSKNNDLFNQLSACLAKFGKAEKSLLYFMKVQDDGKHRDDFKRYFDEKITSGAGSIGNNAAWYGELGARMTPSILMGALAIHLAYQQLKFVGGFGKGVAEFFPFGKFDAWNTEEYADGMMQQIYKLCSDPAWGWKYGDMSGHRAIVSSKFHANRVVALLLTIAAYYGMKKSWKDVVAPKAEMGKRFQSCMIDVSEIVEATQEMGELINKNDTIAEAIPGYKEVLGSISGEKGKELKNILDMFDSSSFHGQATAIGPKGGIFKAFKAMCENANKFTEIMRFVSRLDALMAVVKALRASANNPAKYCIPKILKSDDGKPYLCAKNFWHPTLDPRKVVTNDIELGKTYRNIILTGANAGGKTTWMQALALVAVLAQTFGIVPAESASLTPFTLVIADTRAETKIGEESMFQNEVNKLIGATEKMKSLGADKFAIYIVDEPLKSSSSEHCANDAYKAIGSLGLNQNALVVVATHFEKLAELGDQDKVPAAIKGVFTNYKVDSRLYESAKYSDKFLHHTYKVIPGVITEIVTDFLLQEAYKKHNLINISTTDKASAFEFIGNKTEDVK